MATTTNWELMYVIAEGTAEQETWYTDETEELYRIVLADGTEVITDDSAWGDND